MTGPQHAREALRLAEYSKQPAWTNADNQPHTPTEDERHRVLTEAHLHASLARTAALTDAIVWAGEGPLHRTRDAQNAWDDTFDTRH